MLVLTRFILALGVLLTVAQPHLALAQGTPNLAPGFTERLKSSKLVLVPVDMELFSISAGGVMEPKADWTQAAIANFSAGLSAQKDRLGESVLLLKEDELDELNEINALHGAVARSVFVHHSLAQLKLPTKNNLLDWSMGDAVKPLKDKTGADYALFIWIRDSYASAERKATMVVMAILGVGLAGGSQTGYASLVDLNTGRVVWFNNLLRTSGDLREAKPAIETVDALLKGFPPAR